MIVQPADRPANEQATRADMDEDRRRYATPDRYRTAVLIGVVLAVVYLMVVIWAVASSSYDTWGGYVVAPMLFFAAAPMLRRMLRAVEPDRWVRGAVMAGLAGKLLGAYARFYTNEYVIGRGDSVVYHRHGSAVAAEFRQFIFGGPEYQNSIQDLIGTDFIRLLTALYYTVIGSTRIGGFVAFSFMSFWGLYFFYRAFSVAMPDGLRRRYVILLFFLPSMVFWPSSIGKEAWMTTMLGLGSYGLARLLKQMRFAYPMIVAAMAGMTMVRPHVAAIFGVGLGAGFLLSRSSGGAGKAKKILGLLFFAIVAGLVLRQLQDFFGLEEGLDAQAVFEKTSSRSDKGGSQFDSNQPTSVADLPWAVITVLFRPFLYEAGSAAGVFTALEGTILLGLFAWNAPRLVRLPSLAIARPYVGYVLAYSLVFTFAFSSISNFGILARQRTQLLPFVAVILAVPIESKLRTRRLAGQRPRHWSESTGSRPIPPERTKPGPVSVAAATTAAGHDDGPARRGGVKGRAAPNGRARLAERVRLREQDRSATRGTGNGSGRTGGGTRSDSARSARSATGSVGSDGGGRRSRHLEPPPRPV